MKYQTEVEKELTPDKYRWLMQIRGREVQAPATQPLQSGPLTIVATHLSPHTPELNVQARLLQERFMQASLLHQSFLISSDGEPFAEPFIDRVALQCYEVPGINTQHMVSQRLVLVGWDVRACMYQTFKFLLSSPGSHLEFHVPYGPAEDAKYNAADSAQEASYHLAMSMDLYAQGAGDLRGGGRVALNGVALEEIGAEPDRTSIHFYTSIDRYIAHLLQESNSES